MSFFDILKKFSGGRKITGSEEGELIVGSFGNDEIHALGGNDLVFGLTGDDKISAGDGNDKVVAGRGDDDVSGGNGEDTLKGGRGDDTITGNKGDDRMFGGRGNDQLVWNNGDGSDLMHGGKGVDEVQVNFNTDLVNDDLQNSDVAEYSVTSKGVQFARTELNGQTERGLFQLDIRETEELETNFGGGDDAAVIKGAVLEEIKLDLDGGDGVDTLDLSQAAAAAKVDLTAGTLNGSVVVNFENVIGTEYDDRITGDNQDNVMSGLGGVDRMFGRSGDDTLVGNKGNDFVFGGGGNDKIVWNNGDGSDLFNGGSGDDLVQVNFNTDLVNDDLQNKDVAEYSVTSQGVQFARIEVNDQTEAGLFQLDIRDTETLETNFGDGDDAAVITDNVLTEIKLDLDGGEGVDLLDFSQSATGIDVNLESGLVSIVPESLTSPASIAINFEQVIGSDGDDIITGNDQDNVIRGGVGDDIMTGGAGADTFVFEATDFGVDVITDFELGIDQLLFRTDNPDVTTDSIMGNLTQVGDDVELAFNNRVITINDTEVTDFNADDFMIV